MSLKPVEACNRRSRWDSLGRSKVSQWLWIQVAEPKGTSWRSPTSYADHLQKKHSRFEPLTSPTILVHSFIHEWIQPHSGEERLAPRRCSLLMSPGCPRCGVASHRAPDSQLYGQRYCARKENSKVFTKVRRKPAWLCCIQRSLKKKPCTERGRVTERRGASCTNGLKEVSSKGLASMRGDLWPRIR